MDYEKAYKGARERCRWQLANKLISEECATDLFRDIKESEDERIRKMLISLVKNSGEWVIPENKEKVLTWLEHLQEYLEDIRQYAYNKGLVDAKQKYEKEQEPVDYAEELKKCNDNPLYFYDKYVKVKQKPAEWSEEDEGMYELFSYVIELVENCPDKEKVKNWIKGIKGRFINSDYRSVGLHYILRNNHKSWKPSEEQMEALKLIVSNKKHYAPVLHEIALDTLYNDLKSL